MDVKKVALLIGAILVAAVTMITVRSMFLGAGARQAQAAPAVPMGPKVLVARKSLPVGTIVDAESLSFQAWPKELIQNAYYLEGAPDSDMTKLLGTVVRNPVTAGQPMTHGSLVGPNDRGFLAAALGAGMRAVTVPVTKASGVAGFVFPGDHVDLVLTQTVSGGGDGAPLKVSETIVRNLRVLATDQRIDGKSEDGKMEAKYSDNVTLEATPRIAEKIAVAQSMGSLSLSLRSIADNATELERAVAAGDIKVANGTNPADERRILLSLAGRPADTNTTYTTGGDVSRFQRRSVPGSAAAAASSLNNFATAGSGHGSAAPAGAGNYTGPVVRISRGNTVSLVPVGAK